jgi:hypothetical protein
VVNPDPVAARVCEMMADMPPLDALQLPSSHLAIAATSVHEIHANSFQGAADRELIAAVS